MAEQQRVRIFLVAAAVFFGLFCAAALGLPKWGDFHGPYGEYVAHMAVYERHGTDTINTINYDYRGFDTLGEEFILFTASVGIMLLLRRDLGSENPGKVPDRAALSSTVRAITLPAAALTLVFGFYVAVHGQLTPGGGFQGGVILATAPVLMYLAENTRAFTRITSGAVMEAIEAAGAGAYAVIGVIPLCLGLPLLTNFLPFGTTSEVFSSGTIALISATVGVEVTASFLLVIHTYLQEIILQGKQEEPS